MGRGEFANELSLRLTLIFALSSSLRHTLNRFEGEENMKTKQRTPSQREVCVWERAGALPTLGALFDGGQRLMLVSAVPRYLVEAAPVVRERCSFSLCAGVSGLSMMT